MSKSAISNVNLTREGASFGLRLSKGSVFAGMQKRRIGFA